MEWVEQDYPTVTMALMEMEAVVPTAGKPEEGEVADCTEVAVAVRRYVWVGRICRSSRIDVACGYLLVKPITLTEHSKTYLTDCEINTGSEANSGDNNVGGGGGGGSSMITCEGTRPDSRLFLTGVGGIAPDPLGSRSTTASPNAGNGGNGVGGAVSGLLSSQSVRSHLETDIVVCNTQSGQDGLVIAFVYYLDSDSDGSNDHCQAGGCPDPDSDGILSCSDDCPNETGETDSDADGSCDQFDICVGDDATCDIDLDDVCDGSDGSVELFCTQRGAMQTLFYSYTGVNGVNVDVQIPGGSTVTYEV